MSIHHRTANRMAAQFVRPTMPYVLSATLSSLLVSTLLRYYSRKALTPTTVNVPQ